MFRRTLGCSSSATRAPKRSRRSALRLVQLVEVMQRPHRELGVLGVDQEREFDLGGGDGADVDLAIGQRLERPRRDAGVAAHADYDHRYLGAAGRAVEPLIADLL